VLLVEDDEMNRVVISMFLDDEVGAITEAHNGLEAIVIAFRELKAGAAREEGAAGEGRAAAGGGGEGGASSQPASPLAHRAAAAPASPVLRANGGAAGGAAAGGGAAGIDVIVMDVNMPMLSGRQAAQLVRLMQYGVSCWAGAIPIVALTANAMDSELRKCINAGMTACLTKPVPRQALLDICATALSTGRRANGEGAAAPSGAEAAEAMRAQVDASRPLLCELGSLLVTALRHTVGVRLDMAGRAAALLGCLGWALQLLGAEPEAVRQIDALLADAAAHGLSEDALTARARSLLAERGQDWLEQAGLVDAAQAALSAP
jgi:CheY-like chemotaxis protein